MTLIIKQNDLINTLKKYKIGGNFPKIYYQVIRSHGCVLVTSLQASQRLVARRFHTMQGVHGYGGQFFVRIIYVGRPLTQDHGA